MSRDGEFSRSLGDGLPSGSELGRRARAKRRLELQNGSGLEDPGGPGDETEIGRLVSQVETEPIEWLWDRRIPLGELTILDGDPGTGKSTFLTDVIARVTTGRSLPYHRGESIEGDAMYITTEDSPGRTIRPRLEAAGADVESVRLVTEIEGEDDNPRPFFLPDDIDPLEQTLHGMDARLVVIDPLMAHLGGSINAHKDSDVRRALAPLAGVAHRLNVAVVAVRHLNKSGRAKAKYRGGGSIGIIGAARVGLLLAEHPEREGTCVLASVKNNLAVHPSSLTLELVQAPDHDVARVEWMGATNYTPDELLQGSTSRGRPGEKQREAREFLRDELADGPVPTNDVQEKADEEGIATKTLERAKAALGVDSVKTSFDGPWRWTLPKEAPDSAADNSDGLGGNES